MSYKIDMADLLKHEVETVESFFTLQILTIGLCVTASKFRSREERRKLVWKTFYLKSFPA